MRRDMDLVRAILLAVEENEDPYELLTPSIEGYSELQICHHIALLADAGLVNARDRSAIGVYYWSAGPHTWAGHELLDLMRNDELWDVVKRRVCDVSHGFACSELVEEAKSEVRRRIAAQRGD